MALSLAGAASRAASSLERHQRGASTLNARPQRCSPASLAPPARRLGVVVQAKGKATPPDVPKPRGRQGGREWLQSILSRFGPVKEKASNTTVLDFEKPLVELDNRIKEVRGCALQPHLINPCVGGGGGGPAGAALLLAIEH